MQNITETRHFNEEKRSLYNVVERFRDTLIAPVIEKLLPPEQYEKLCELLQSTRAEIRTGRKTPETTTFGDVAALLNDWYRQPKEQVEAMADEILWGLSFYFECFDMGRAEGIPQSVRDFQALPFEVFYRFAEETGSLPEESRKAYAECPSEGMSAYEFFHELRADYNYHILADGFTNQAALEYHAQLVYLFVCPLAAIQRFPIMK